MFCGNCGAKLEEGDFFCANCGTKVADMLVTTDEDDKTVLLENEEQAEAPTEAQEEIQAEEQSETQTEEQEEIQVEEQSETQTEEQKEIQVEEQTVEEAGKIEAIEISPTGVVEAGEAAMVPAGSFTQKKFCPNCGTENGIDDLFCQSCGLSFGNTDQIPQSSPDKTNKEKIKKMAPIVVAAVAAAAVVIVAWCIMIPRVFGGREAKTDFVLYVKDNELNMAKSGKFEPLQIDEKCYEDKDSNKSFYGYYVTCTPDNKYIYYPHNLDINTYTYDLYRRKLGDKKAETEEIDSNVVAYEIIDNDRVVYVKDNDDRKLYIYSKGQATRIAADVSPWEIKVSDDGKNVMWRTSDGDGMLYVQDTAMKGEKIKLDSDVTYIYASSDDLKTIVYEKDDNLYILKDLKEREKIASDVEGVSVYGINDDLQIYYTKEGDDVALTVYDLIDDDCLASDQNMKEPRIEDYQTVTYVNDFFGTREKVEISDDYYDALEEYQQKLIRDDYRLMMQDDSLGGVWVEFYYYNFKKDENSKVTEAVWFDGGILGTDTALMYFWTIDIESFDGPKMSRLSKKDYSDILEDVEQDILECYKLKYVEDGEVFEIPTMETVERDDFQGVVVLANEAAHMIYLQYQFVEWNSRGEYEAYSELYRYDYKTSADPVLISDEVYSVEWVDADGIYYINEDEELYCDGEKIDSDVYSYSISAEGDGKLLYLTDINKDQNEGTLKLYQNGKTTKIADDVAIYRYSLFDGNKIAFLADYNFSKNRGDLEVYNGKEIIRVDTDVQAFFICD